jgi:hypothetical protein
MKRSEQEEKERKIIQGPMCCMDRRSSIEIVNEMGTEQGYFIAEISELWFV